MCMKFHSCVISESHHNFLKLRKSTKCTFLQGLRSFVLNLLINVTSWYQCLNVYLKSALNELSKTMFKINIDHKLWEI